MDAASFVEVAAFDVAVGLLEIEMVRTTGIETLTVVCDPDVEVLAAAAAGGTCVPLDAAVVRTAALPDTAVLAFGVEALGVALVRVYARGFSTVQYCTYE